MKEVSNEVLVKLWVEYLPRFKYYTTEDWKVYTYTNRTWYRERKPVYDPYKLYNVIWIWGKKILWHRLILMNYVDQPEDKTDCNHKNGNKLDNRLENLEWCDKSYNIREAQRLWLKPTKKFYQFNEQWELVRIWDSIHDAELVYWLWVRNAIRYRKNWVKYTRQNWFRWNTENIFPDYKIYK